MTRHINLKVYCFKIKKGRCSVSPIFIMDKRLKKLLKSNGKRVRIKFFQGITDCEIRIQISPNIQEYKIYLLQNRFKGNPLVNTYSNYHYNNWNYSWILGGYVYDTKTPLNIIIKRFKSNGVNFDELINAISSSKKKLNCYA